MKTDPVPSLGQRSPKRSMGSVDKSCSFVKSVRIRIGTVANFHPRGKQSHRFETDEGFRRIQDRGFGNFRQGRTIEGQIPALGLPFQSQRLLFSDDGSLMDLETQLSSPSIRRQPVATVELFQLLIGIFNLNN